MEQGQGYLDMEKKSGRGRHTPVSFGSKLSVDRGGCHPHAVDRHCTDTHTDVKMKRKLT